MTEIADRFWKQVLLFCNFFYLTTQSISDTCLPGFKPYANPVFVAFLFQEILFSYTVFKKKKHF